MSSSEARPRQVTMAAWLVGAGSMFLLFSVVGAMGELRSVAFREQIEAVAWRETLGLDVDAAIVAARVMLFVAGAAAAAAVVAAVYCARRDRSARIVASVAAAVVFLLSAVTDPLLAAFVAAGATLLWTGQAGDWFAGRPLREVPSLMPTRGDGGAKPTSGTAPGTGPASTPNAGPGAGARASVRPRPPQEVTMAAIITATTSAAVVVGMVLDTARYLLDPDSLAKAYAESGMQGEGFTESFWTVGLVVGASIVTIWALSAVALAWLSARRHAWARILLMVSAGVAALTTLALAFTQPLALVVTLACAATLYLLSRPGVRRWYADPGPVGGPGEGPSTGTGVEHQDRSRTDA